MNTVVLVTGAFGYIGGRVAAHLAGIGRTVPRMGSRRPHDTPLAGGAPCQRAVMNFSDPASLERACQGVSAVVHCAAVNEIESARDPELALTVNAMGTLRLLRAAQRAGVRRFLYFSTAHIYGAPLAGDIDETTVPRPVHPYAITHRVAEDFVLAAHDAGQLDGVVVRLANGFGAPMHPGVDRWTLVVNDMCRQAAAQKGIAVRSPEQVRDFVPLDDVANAVAHLLDLPRVALGNGLFNLGGGRTMTMLEMAETVAGCCLSTLGFLPRIELGQGTGMNRGALTYRRDKLLATGFVPADRFLMEIEATLRLCAASFPG